jgi:hypothetical protein
MINVANVQGKLMLTESLAGYSSLMVMEKEYGLENMSKFLKYEQNKYKMKRGNEEFKEVPLYLAYNQSYIAKNKGSVILYALQDYIGEENMNLALTYYLQEYLNDRSKYPTSLDLMEHIRKETPDTLKYLVDELFRSVVIFNNKIDSSFFTKREDDKYDIRIYTTTEKYKYDSLGKQKEVEPADWIDLGVFTKSSSGNDTLVYLSKKHIIAKQSEFHLTLNTLPKKVGIDPNYKLMDKELDDNIADIRIKN